MKKKINKPNFCVKKYFQFFIVIDNVIIMVDAKN